MAELKISPPPFPNREEHPFVATVRFRKLVIDIENLDGSTREGTDSNGKPWKTEFRGAHYGEIRDSRGTDGDALDVYIKNPPDDGANMAYIIHQNHPRTHPKKPGEYDEDKVVLGVSSAEEAKELYLRHYNRKDFLRSVTEMAIEPFKRYIFGENKAEKVAHWGPQREEHAPGSLPWFESRMAQGVFKDPQELQRALLLGRHLDQVAGLLRRRYGHAYKESEKAEKVADAATAFIRMRMRGNAMPNECKTPGEKLRSKGQGRGEARGKGRGPLGIPVGKKEKEMKTAQDLYKIGYELGMHEKLAQMGAAPAAAGPALTGAMMTSMPRPSASKNIPGVNAPNWPSQMPQHGGPVTPISELKAQMSRPQLDPSMFKSPLTAG